MTRLIDIDREGRGIAYQAALEAGGTAGVIDVLDAAIIRALIQWVAATPAQRKRTARRGLCFTATKEG